MKNVKRIIFSVLFSILVVTGVAFSEFFPDIIVTSPNGIWTDTRTYSNLNTALTAIGANVRDVYIVREESVVTATIDSNIHLNLVRNGSINNSGQLTINTRNIEAPDRQIFTGIGDIDFISGSVVRSAWFSDIVETFNVTNDDSITLIVSKQDNITANCSVGNDINLKWESPNNRIIADSGFELSNIKNIEAGNYQLFAGAGDFDFLDGSRLKLDWFARLRSVLTWVESEEVVIVVSGANLVDYSNNLTDNEYLDVVSESGILSISAGVTLTLPSPDNLITNPNRQIIAGAGDINFTLGGSGAYVNWWSTLANAIVDIGATEIDLNITSTITIADGTTVVIPSTITLDWADGSTIQGIAGGGVETLTINCKFDENLSQLLFDITNLTIDGTPIISKASPLWFAENTTPGTTDMIDAIDLAIALIDASDGGEVEFPAGIYGTSAPIYTTRGLYIHGAGYTDHDSPPVTLKPLATFASATFMGSISNRFRGVNIENFKIDMSVAPANTYGIEFGGGWYSNIRNVQVRNLSNATHIGVYLHPHAEGPNWNTVEQTIVKTGSTGTGFRVSDDNPYAGGAPGSAKPTQTTFINSQASTIDDGWVFDGAGGGMSLITCQSETIANTAVLVTDHSTNEGAYPTLIGGEFGGDISFDGPMLLQNTISNAVTTEYQNGAIFVRIDANRLEFGGSSSDTFFTAPDFFLNSVKNSQGPSTTVASGGTETIMRFKDGANRHVVGLILIRAYRDGTPSTNRYDVGFLSSQDDGDLFYTSLANHNGGANAITYAYTVGAGGDAGYNILTANHTLGYDVIFVVSFAGQHNISGL